jgi:gamma-butyrobetaine dioxygenase
MSTMDVRVATLLPAVAASPAHARVLLALDGAAIIRDVGDLDTALALGGQVLDGRVRRIGPQFEVTPNQLADEAAAVMAQPADGRGRQRYRGPMDADQPAHNDGFGFGDFAPDHMFLWCTTPCAMGGASFLVDAVRLLSIVSAPDPHFADFAWTVPIDHSVPNFPQPTFEPIARYVNGRVQVRCHPDMAAAPGPDEQRNAIQVATWMKAVAEARSAGAQFRLQAGDLLCIDNYRMLHGRNGYVQPTRSVTSIWAWTSSALRVPTGALDIAVPNPIGKNDAR